jgi:CMP-2-keto-3-deoxyoctulosonic acid synthetase
VLGTAVPATAAPNGSDANAEQTIAQLEQQGNRVVVNRQSDTPLGEASVVSITRGPVMRQNLPHTTSNGDSTQSVVGQTIYVAIR